MARLCDWFACNRLLFNMSTTGCMVFHNIQFEGSFDMDLWVGVIIDSDVRFLGPTLWWSGASFRCYRIRCLRRAVGLGTRCCSIITLTYTLDCCMGWSFGVLHLVRMLFLWNRVAHTLGKWVYYRCLAFILWSYYCIFLNTGYVLGQVTKLMVMGLELAIYWNLLCLTYFLKCIFAVL